MGKKSIEQKASAICDSKDKVVFKTTKKTIISFTGGAISIGVIDAISNIAGGHMLLNGVVNGLETSLEIGFIGLVYLVAKNVGSNPAVEESNDIKPKKP